MADARPTSWTPGRPVEPALPALDGLVPAAPDERGTLEVRTKALQHIVERIVLDTAGTVARTGTLGRIVGATSPSVSIAMHGRRARVTVDVAAPWPCHATGIATDVRERVLREATELSGVDVGSVDVTVHLVGADDSDRERNLR